MRFVETLDQAMLSFVDRNGKFRFKWRTAVNGVIDFSPSNKKKSVGNSHKYEVLVRGIYTRTLNREESLLLLLEKRRGQGTRVGSHV